MTNKVKLIDAGMDALRKNEQMQALVKDAAEKIAAEVRSQGIRVGDRDGGPHEAELPVVVREGVTDRAHATVYLAHPAGVAVQAKHGALTRAASAIGVSVHG
jgi:hypothetical protein